MALCGRCRSRVRSSLATTCSGFVCVPRPTSTRRQSLSAASRRSGQSTIKARHIVGPAATGLQWIPTRNCSRSRSAKTVHVGQVCQDRFFFSLLSFTLNARLLVTKRLMIVKWNSEKNVFDTVPGKLAQIAVGKAGDVWGVSNTQKVFRWDDKKRRWVLFIIIEFRLLYLFIYSFIYVFFKRLLLPVVCHSFRNSKAMFGVTKNNNIVKEICWKLKIEMRKTKYFRFGRRSHDIPTQNGARRDATTTRSRTQGTRS